MAPSSDRPRDGRDRSALRVPIWLQRSSAWARHLLVLGVAVVGVIWVVLRLRTALVPFLIAVMFAAALRPLAERLRRRGVPRALAAAVPLLGLAVCAAAAAWFVYVRASETLDDDQLNRVAVRTRIDEWLMGPPFEFSAERIDELERSVRSWFSSGIDSFGTREATLAVEVAAGGILTVVLTYFLVKDGPAIWRTFGHRVSPVRRRAVQRAGAAVADTLSAYLHGVVLTGVADALLIGLGLWLLGVPLVIPLMLLTATAALFPVVGAVVAGAAATVVALVTQGPTTAIWVALLALVVQQVEGNVLHPLILSRRVSIHPVAVLVSLAAGGAAAGLAGAFLAVPLVAAVTSAVRAVSTDMSVAPNGLDQDGADESVTHGVHHRRTFADPAGDHPPTAEPPGSPRSDSG